MISVVIPTLNEEKYIEPTLRALKNQDYNGKYEIIVADSCSKDKTMRIAKKYADKIIKVKKRSIGAGRNAGAEVAKGDIFVFIDADTIVLPNTISELVRPFKNKKVVGTTCPVITLSADIRDFMTYWGYNQFVKTSIEVKKPQIAGMCCMYRKDVFEKIGGFDEKLKMFEDLDLSKRIAKHGKIVFVEKTLVLTSPRRMKAWGRTKGPSKYISYYLNYVLTGKSVSSRKFKPVR